MAARPRARIALMCWDILVGIFTMSYMPLRSIKKLTHAPSYYTYLSNYFNYQ